MHTCKLCEKSQWLFSVSSICLTCQKEIRYTLWEPKWSRDPEALLVLRDWVLERGKEELFSHPSENWPKWVWSLMKEIIEDSPPF